MLLDCLLFITLFMPSIEQQTRIKNKKKLTQHNIHLHRQLMRLQEQIQRLQDIDNQKAQNKLQPDYSELTNQIQLQHKQLRQIREALENGRRENPQENIIYIRKEENELTQMKRELENLKTQRKVLMQVIDDKKQKLAGNEPLQKHKQEMQSQWTQAKKQNRQNNLKIVEMQRQERRLHNLLRQSKGDSSQVIGTEAELQKLIQELTKKQQQLKEKQDRWKPNLQVLDQEFFTAKNDLNSLLKKIQQLEKDQGIWRTRAAAVRDQSQIEEDKNRLAKLGQLKYQLPIDIIKKTTPRISQIRTYPHIVVPKKEEQKQQSLKRAQSSQNAPKKAKILAIDSSSSKKIASPKNINNKSLAQISTKIKMPVQPSPKIKQSVVKPQVKVPIKSISKEKSNKAIDKSLVVKQVIPQSAKIQLALNLNANSSIGRKTKIKSRHIDSNSNSQPISLAEQIKNKAQQIKKINRKLQKEVSKDRSMSSLIKKNTQVTTPRAQTSISTQGLKQVDKKYKQKKAIQLVTSTPQIKNLKKNVAPIQMPKVSNKIVQKIVSKEKTVAQNRYEEKSNRKQKIQFINLVKQKPPTQKEPIKKAVKQQKPIQPPKSPKKQSPKQKNSPKIKQKSPKSTQKLDPPSTPRPKIEIIFSDNIQGEAQIENIRKVIRKKKNPALVAAATST